MQENNELIYQQSDNLDLYFKSLIDFQSKCPKIEKTETVSYGKTSYKFAPLDKIIDTVRPILSKCRLAFTQELIGKKMIKTTIFHESGQFRSATMAWESATWLAQDMGKDISYYKRYALSSMLGLSIGGEDNDAGKDKPDYGKMSKENQKALLPELNEEYINSRPQFYKRLNDALMAITDEIWHIDLKDYLSQTFVLKPGIIDLIEDELLKFRHDHGYVSSYSN